MAEDAFYGPHGKAMTPRAVHPLCVRTVTAVTALGECDVLELLRRLLDQGKTMRYQVQFLDGLDNVLRETRADARSAGTAFLRGASIAWPPHAIRVRVLDRYGRTLSVSKSRPKNESPA